MTSKTLVINTYPSAKCRKSGARKKIYWQIIIPDFKADWVWSSETFKQPYTYPIHPRMLSISYTDEADAWKLAWEEISRRALKVFEL